MCQCSAGIQGYGSFALVLNAHFSRREGLGQPLHHQELLRSWWGTLGFKNKNNINKNPTSLLSSPRRKTPKFRALTHKNHPKVAAGSGCGVLVLLQDLPQFILSSCSYSIPQGQFCPVWEPSRVPQLRHCWEVFAELMPLQTAVRNCSSIMGSVLNQHPSN